MRKLFFTKTKATGTANARKALKSNGFTYSKQTKTWIRGGGFFNIEEMIIQVRIRPDHFFVSIVPAPKPQITGYEYL